MSHSFVKIWVHVIFATKERAGLIRAYIAQDVYRELSRQLETMECPVKNINGMPDHVHILFMLNKQKALADVLKQVKGATAHWINNSGLIREHFGWQTGYAAFSVSESQLGNVDRYIARQQEHHRIKPFQEEYDAFLSANGLLSGSMEAGNG
jgi:REP element-mobilizing transposase RayT